MNSFTVTLFGIGGVYNYGCEAQVRGTELILKKKYPNATVKYMSYRPEDDIKRLEGSEVIVEPLIKPRYSISSRVLNKIRGKFNISQDKRLLGIELDWADSSDVILSIGGDVYNLLSNERYEQKKYWNQRIAIGKKIKKKHNKFIIWGASTGPFEENTAAKKIFIDHFKNDVDMITVREKNTEAYLSKNGVLNHKLYSDPAFAIDSPTKEKFNDKPLIGINLSPLSIKYCYNIDEKEQVIKEQIGRIESIIEKYDANILLIPHVVSDFKEGDDDLRYLEKIYEGITKGKEHVSIVKYDPGFLGIKKELIKCDVILAARMHCGINAVSCAVPTIFIGYSDKASGMCEHVYEDLKYYMTLEGFSKDDSLIKEALDNKEQINLFLKGRIPVLKKSAYEAVGVIEE
jgi:colanic acid/amylovoran biosynthesis protein